MCLNFRALLNLLKFEMPFYRDSKSGLLGCNGCNGVTFQHKKKSSTMRNFALNWQIYIYALEIMNDAQIDGIPYFQFG